jgi:hypothetical protein
MATCSYCEQRKGKRSCPALGGTICSQCCGQHRLQDIDCPSACIYLGGLSIVRDPARTDAAFTKDDYNSTWEKLHAFGGGRRVVRDEAFARFFDDDTPPPEWEQGVGIAYLYYGYRDADGQRVIDHFLAARGRGMSRGEVAATVALQHAWASLFEVTSVQTGIGLDLRDLLSGETIHVREVSATGHLKKWDVLFAWVMAFPDHMELTGAACFVPRPHLDRVRRALDVELARARRERPGVADRELVGPIAWAPVRALREALRDFKMPKMQTTDGEDLLLCTAHFAIQDAAAVRDRLATAPDFESDDDGDYTWLNREGNAVMGPGPVTLGRVRIADGELVLETMSRERIERGKRLIESMLGELVAHRIDSIQDPESAMREHKGSDREDADEIPEDVQREVVGQYLRDHYRRWLDDPLPALAGKSPRKAARTKRGRAQADALLKEIENGSIGMPGGDAVDFAGMRRELGLEAPTGRELDGAYDADFAPDPAYWLDMDESLKTRAVEEHHRGLADHPDTPNKRLHALVHVIVENQLASGDPTEVRATLERLVGAGLSRHEAIHAIGSVMAEAIFEVQKKGTPFDRAATARSLEHLRADVWRFA